MHLNRKGKRKNKMGLCNALEDVNNGENVPVKLGITKEEGNKCCGQGKGGREKAGAERKVK